MHEIMSLLAIEPAQRTMRSSGSSVARDLCSGGLPMVVRLGIDAGGREAEWFDQKLAKYTTEAAKLCSVDESAVLIKMSELHRAPGGELDPPEDVTTWRKKCEQVRKLRIEIESKQTSYSRLMSIAPTEVREDAREVRQYQKLYQSIARLRADLTRLQEAAAAAEAKA